MNDIFLVKGCACLIDMDLLREYDSDNDSGEANAQELENGSRSVYLIMYSQADKAVFPTRKDFALGVVKSFSSGKAKVVQWCC